MEYMRLTNSRALQVPIVCKCSCIYLLHESVCYSVIICNNPNWLSFLKNQLWMIYACRHNVDDAPVIILRWMKHTLFDFRHSLLELEIVKLRL